MTQSINLEKVFTGVVVSIFILMLYLMIPTGSIGDYVIDNQVGVASKQEFRVDYENYIQTQQKQLTQNNQPQVNSLGGQRVADVAMREFEYFSTHNLSGGRRYWRWFNYIPELVKSKQSSSIREPLEDSAWVAGLVPASGNYDWCNIFVSCVAQEAGFSSGAAYSGSGLICMGLRCTNTFEWCINNGSKGYVLSNSNLYKHIDIFRTQCKGEFEIVDSYKPTSGDLIFFYNNGSSDGRFSHIGIVYSVVGNTVTTIEGNVGNSSPSLSKVEKKEYELNNPRISGYVHPPYEGS